MQFVPVSNLHDYKNRLWGLMVDIKKLQFTEGVKCHSRPSSVAPGLDPDKEHSELWKT